ncbi:hypothetical protein [Chitinivorax sp. B]|uniref:hypothetical protein n=1 Tax=Chitinivorax sp. B TaxID=2502235 RepID=UPI001485301F|nr:hypothetical protein [Chitinivorax sp. B]
MLLFITDDRVYSYCTDGAQIRLHQYYQADEGGLATFSHDVAAQRDARYAVLVDVAEEDFIVELLPHVTGRDHRALMARKLQNQFRGIRYANGWVQGRETEGRRDDRVLFSGIINPDLLDRWLNVLDQHQVPLVGIYSLALLCTSLAKRLHHDDDHVLLVSIQAENGVRQCYYRQGELKFSRLTLSRDHDELMVEHIIGECTRTRQYVASLRMINRDTPLHVLVLADEDHQHDLAGLPPDTEEFTYQLIDPTAVARTFKLSAAADRNLVQILLRLIQRGWRNHYAPPERMRHLRLWQARRALLAAAGMCLGVGVAVAGWLLADAHDLERRRTELVPQALAAEQRARSLQVITGEYDPSIMRQVVERIEQLRRTWPVMNDRWQALSMALDQSLDLRLHVMEWTVGTGELPYRLDEDAPPVLPSAPEEGEVDFESQPKIVTWRERFVVRGSVEPWSDDYRRADIRVAELARGLQRRDTQLDITLAPLDTRPTGTVTLPPADIDKVPPQHSFELTLSRAVIVEAP